MDLFDRAQEIDAMFRKQAIERQLQKAKQGESATVCKECEEEIPEARRIASPGCTLCIECARELEKSGMR